MEQKVFDLDDEWQVVLTLNKPFVRAYVNLRHKGNVSPSGSTKVLVQPRESGHAYYASSAMGHDPCEIAIIANVDYETKK
jgi:hypothetical protein